MLIVSLILIILVVVGYGIFGTACDGCGEVFAGFVLVECEDCDTVYCIDNGCVEACFNECEGCDGYLCYDCGKHWRGDLYCEDCYVFPHDN